VTSVREDLHIHKVANERNFCACVFSGGGQDAVDNCGWLSPDQFTDRKLAEFWAQVLQHEDALRAANDTGLTNELINYCTQAPTLARVDEYARLIAEDAYLMTVLSELSEIARDISNRDSTSVISKIDNLHAKPITHGKQGFTPEIIDSEFRQVIRDDSPSLMTRLPAIDNILGGLFGGELIVIASRPGMGKTQLVLQIGRVSAIEGKKVLFFSLEMQRVQLWARMACPLAGYEWKDVRAKRVDEEGLVKIEEASISLRRRLGSNFIVQDEEHSIFGIHQACVRYRPDLVIIDQLPDVIWHDPNEKKLHWYGKACKYFRHYIAKKLDAPLILVHQLSRKPEDRPDKRPQMADLRDSGEIEQRADVIGLGYRQDVYKGRAPGQHKVPFELVIEKNRQGNSKSTALLDYDLKAQWFA
jgi:replicative DNA helicase